MPKQKSTITNAITGKTVMEQDYGFTISNIPAKVIQIENLVTSYTFHITRDTITTPNVFENLVILTDTTNVVKAYTIKYFLNAQPTYISEHDAYNINAYTEITPIIYNTTQAKVSYTDSDGCSVITIMCPYEYAHPAGDLCFINHGDVLYLAKDSSNCGDTAGGGGGNTGGDGGGSTGGGSTAGGSNSGNNSSDLPEDITGSIIHGGTLTSPVLNEILLQETPCDKIKNGTNSAAYKRKFKEHNTPEHFRDTLESGFGQVGSKYIDGTANARGEIDYPDNSKNGTHVHNNDVIYYTNTNITYDKNIKMISPQDIRALMEMKSYNMTPTGIFTPEDTFHAMISNEGIFAITILEPINWDNDLKDIVDKFESYYNEKVKYISDNYPDMNSTSRKKYLEKMFLKGLTKFNLDSSIGLFEGEVENENATDINDYTIKWTKKTLKKVFLGYDVEPTPCN